jgi:hypothetical protein
MTTYCEYRVSHPEDIYKKINHDTGRILRACIFYTLQHC